MVIGASGKTGSRVVVRLRSQIPVNKIKAASRQSEVYFDWQYDDSWNSALDGISHVYLTYYPDLAVPNSIGHISAFCDLAKLKGVQHITLLSGRGEPAAQACEKILMECGIDWTVVRASWFNQNFSDGFFKDFIVAGQICLPVSGVKEPFVDADDIAEVAVKSLIAPALKNQLFEVTGPELLSFSDIANLFSSTLVRQIEFTYISPPEFEAMMLAQGAPHDVIKLLNFLFNEVLDGRNEQLAYGVEAALNRKPKSFKDYINSNIDEF